MKLLFDENLSYKLCHRLEDIFPGSQHVGNLGFEQTASVARVVGWVEARPDGDFWYGLSRAETHHIGRGIVNDGFRRG